ncbi:MAG: dehydrogenase [Synechococcaceae cyanobacterium]|nr:dehydrogenase [Synechococcaceae cyanobacterium]
MLRRLGFSLLVPLLFSPGMAQALDEPWNRMAGEALTGPRTPLPKDWIGLRSLAPETEILVMAGHADSQGLRGSGTPGEAVGRLGAPPMRAGLSDELYWNLLTARAVVEAGRRRGLAIRYYEPPFFSIPDDNNPNTNWSVGRHHGLQGGYALEIHYDAYGPDGRGSGVIPALTRPFNTIDESLAREFGGYPWAYRGGLGGPRRGITLLEIGKLEGRLEQALRDPASRDQTLDAIANRVVDALVQGLKPRLETVGSAFPAPDPRASSGDE